MILGSGLIQASGPSFGTVTADSSDSALLAGQDALVCVYDGAAYIYFGKSGGTWKTLWTDTTGALLRGDELGTYAVTLASDGPAPFNTDDGLATDTHGGAVAAGTTFTHEGDALIEFTVDTLPSVSFVRVFFRKNNNDYWEIAINSSGDVYLSKYTSGVFDSTVSSAASALSGGERIVAICDGNIIKAYADTALLFSYGSATDYKTHTNGAVSLLGGGSAVSDLKTWPRTLSGTAASILNKVSA